MVGEGGLLRPGLWVRCGVVTVVVVVVVFRDLDDILQVNLAAVAVYFPRDLIQINRV